METVFNNQIESSPDIKQDKASAFRGNNVFLLYITSLVAFSVILLTIGVVNQSHSVLLLLTIIYWAVATLPVLFMRVTWITPLFFQMFYEIPKVLSLAYRATSVYNIQRKWITMIPYDDVIHAYIKCIIITCIGLLIEYFIMLRINIRTKGIRIELEKNRKPIILLGIAGIAFFLLMRDLGGLSYVLGNYQSRLTEFGENTNLYYRYVIYWGIIPCLYFYLADYKFLFFVTLVFNVLFFLAIGERGGLVSALGLSLLVVDQLKKRRKIKILKVLMVALVFILAYEIVGSIRDTKDTQYGNNPLIENNLVEQSVDALGNVKHFVISSELIYMIDHHYIDHTWGAPLLNIFYAPIPRKLFPWKPTYIAESALVGSLILDRDTEVYGLPPSMFSYGYLNFGWVGVILFSVICGLFMKWFFSVFILDYLNKGETIPNGNIVFFSLAASYAYVIISTEVQVKMIITIIGFYLLFMLTKPKEN